MKKHTFSRLLGIFVLLTFVFAAFGGVAPALAQGEDPIQEPTIVPPVDGDPDVVVIPDTGAQQDADPGLFSGWTLLIILGVVVVVLLIALVARSGHTHV